MQHGRDIPWNPFPDEIPPRTAVNMRKIQRIIAESMRKIQGKRIPDVNPINTSLDPLLVGEYGEDLNFISTFNMFVITNEETADAYDPFREYLLVTLDLYLPNTNFTKHLKKLPKGTPVPSYLRRPPNPYRKYIVNPGPDDPTGAIFHRRFKEYLDIGFNNLLNRLERGITITDPYFYDPQYDQPPSGESEDNGDNGTESRQEGNERIEEGNRE